MAHVLMMVTSAGKMSDGHPTGLWLEEFAVPWQVLRDAGHEVTVASPLGGKAPLDPRSTGDADAHPEWRDAQALLDKTCRIEDVKSQDYDAVFIPGGHGTMFDFPTHLVLGELLTEFHAQGKPIASVCHGPAAFVGVTRTDGQPLVCGHTVTAFSDSEEQAVGLADAVPFLLAARLRELGATVENGPDFAPLVRRDRQLITGQNPASSRPAAEALLEALAGR